jgi:hypothetical protein
MKKDGRSRTAEQVVQILVEDPLVGASALDDSRLDPCKTPEAQRRGLPQIGAQSPSTPVLNIQDPNVPLPHIKGVADVEELFLSVQLELLQWFRPRLAPKV